MVFIVPYSVTVVACSSYQRIWWFLRPIILIYEWAFNFFPHNLHYTYFIVVSSLCSSFKYEWWKKFHNSEQGFFLLGREEDVEMGITSSRCSSSSFGHSESSKTAWSIWVGGIRIEDPIEMCFIVRGRSSIKCWSWYIRVEFRSTPVAALLGVMLRNVKKKSPGFHEYCHWGFMIYVLFMKSSGFWRIVKTPSSVMKKSRNIFSHLIDRRPEVVVRC